MKSASTGTLAELPISGDATCFVAVSFVALFNGRMCFLISCYATDADRRVTFCKRNFATGFYLLSRRVNTKAYKAYKRACKIKLYEIDLVVTKNRKLFAFKYNSRQFNVIVIISNIVGIVNKIFFRRYILIYISMNGNNNVYLNSLYFDDGKGLQRVYNCNFNYTSQTKIRFQLSNTDFYTQR